MLYLHYCFAQLYFILLIQKFGCGYIPSCPNYFTYTQNFLEIFFLFLGLKMLPQLLVYLIRSFS